MKIYLTKLLEEIDCVVNNSSLHRDVIFNSLNTMFSAFRLVCSTDEISQVLQIMGLVFFKYDLFLSTFKLRIWFCVDFVFHLLYWVLAHSFFYRSLHWNSNFRHIYRLKNSIEQILITSNSKYYNSIIL